MAKSLTDTLLKRVKSIRVASRHGRRSPHKPLLLLLSLGRYLNGDERLQTYGDIEGVLNGLIRRFGLPNSKENPQYPFWHLRNDGLWEIDRPALVRTTTSGDAYVSDLREHGIRGGLAHNVLRVLETNPMLAWNMVHLLLNDFFPPSLHEDVLMDTGLVGKIGLGDSNGKTKTGGGRDRGFRKMVLQAYRNRCALCGLDIRVYDRPIGIEAAHIKWHTAGGPAEVANGMSLCVLHHKFFDAGLFTVTSALTVLVAGLAEGDSVVESLNKYDRVVLPIYPRLLAQRPASEYLDWHARAVFQST